MKSVFVKNKKGPINEWSPKLNAFNYRNNPLGTGFSKRYL